MLPAAFSVRKANLTDYEKVVDYFLSSTPDHLAAMGVDPSKLPDREKWLGLLSFDYYQPMEKKKFFFLIWILDGVPVGHSNINQIIFGREAFMHLHLWGKVTRHRGAGLQFLELTLPHYFQLFNLQHLFCEPLSTNAAPNRTLEKSGFSFVKSYETVPGWINTHQRVNRWLLTREQFESRVRQQNAGR